MSELEGRIQIQADIVPTNLNPRMAVTSVEYVKGAPQVFADIAEMVAFHPNRMKSGMPATVMNWPDTGTITDFRLGVDPTSLKDASNNSIVTIDNFQQYWIVQSQTQKNSTRVYQYSPDGPGGGAPVFPYTLGEETNWTNVRDDSKGHKWMRFRDDDVDSDSDGIFDNWSVPIPISGIFQTGDFIDSRFKREAVSTSTHSGTGTMTASKYYVIQTGTLQINGDLTLNEIGYFGTDTQVVLSKGRIFKFASANTYSFLDSATVIETIQVPPRTLNGTPNNEPVGWSDTVPEGAIQLWEIQGQKSVYGQLKTEWVLRKIIENPDYVRYSNSPSPHPDTIAGINTPAGTGTPEDTALIAAGWSKVFEGQNFIATREDGTGADLYTNWFVRKINEESGEFTERAFKLFDSNLDLSDPILVAPTNRDASNDGWSDTPKPETSTQINYVTEARKFFNGELKTTWSQPVPYTGKDVFIDYIEATPADNFKYSDAGVVTPTTLTLVAHLYKGLKNLSEDSTVSITYVWTRVYNSGAVDTSIAGTNTADNFYYLGATGGAPGAGEYRDGARLVVKPGGVDGQAVFRCVQTVAMAQGEDMVFTQEFTVADVSDGVDAIGFTVTADNDRTIYDSVGASFVPAQIVLRAYWSNITPTLYWYRKIAGVWTALVNGATYAIGGNTCTFNSADLFAADETAQEQNFAVSTHSTNPDSADQEATFSDYITIVKLSAAGVGSPGENSVSAILANETHTIVLDKNTISPVSGEISGDGSARTRVEVYDGITKKTYGTDWTMALASDNANVTFAQRFYDADGSGGGAASTTDGEVYVSAWTAGQRKAKCTITITYGSRIIVKQFSVASTLDAPGAVLLDIDSDKGYTFTPADKTNKTLTAKLYDTSLTGSQLISLPDAAYQFRWNVAGAWSTLSTSNTRAITQGNILISSNVTVEVYKDGVLFRSRTINITDVNDGKFYRAWTDSVTKPSASQDLSSQDPTGGSWPVTVSGVVWRLPTDAHWATNAPSFAQDATASGATYTWGAVYQLKGEKGDQGVNGGFFHTMFFSKVPSDASNPSDPAYTTAPAYGAGGTSSTLAQMKTAGWVSLLPTSGVVWESKRFWIGEAVIFNGSGDPSTSPAVGSTWSPRTRISGKDGAKGDPGASVTGPAGPGYNGSTFLGTDAFGGNMYRLNPVNGAAPTTFTAPKGENAPDVFNGWIKSSEAGSPIFENTAGRWTYIDTEESLTKKLSIVAYMDAGYDGRYTLRFYGNSSATRGGSLLMQRNFMSYQIGVVTQYQMMLNIRTAHRFIIFTIDPQSGWTAGATTAFFGLTVTKIG